MAYRTFITGTITVLGLIVTGCAGPATETGATLTDPASSSARGLSGTWKGQFFHPAADYTSPSSSDLTLQVRDDSTYTFQWGSRSQKTGTIAVQGNRVILQHSSGSPTTFVRSGNDTLYAMAKDDGSHGRTVVMSLARTEATRASDASIARPTRLGQLCHAVGGVFVNSVCQPIATPNWRARCESRGGTYFPGGEYCEVPGGGLRPM